MRAANGGLWYKDITRRYGEAVQVALVFLLLLAVFFWRAVFLGEKLVPGDIVYSDPVYAGYAPSSLTQAHNTLLYDQTYAFYPWRVYATQALQQGFLPWWNPYIYCGSPFIAADQPAVFNPLNVLAYAFSAADAALVTALARLLIAGLTTYWFLRAIGTNRFGALLGGIAYAFGGFMIVFLGHPHTNVAAWLPALFLTLEWLHRKNNPLHVALVALVIAAQLTGGHAELCLFTFTAGGLYYLFRVMSAWWSVHRQQQGWARQLKPVAVQILSFGLAILLGFALAAIQVLPFLEWLQQNAELDLRLATKGAHAVRVGLRHWLAGLPLMILPNLFGNPTWPGDYQSVLPFWNFVEQTLYVGILTLALAVGGVLRRRREATVLFMGALALTALGMALRWPIFDWVNQLPAFSIAAPGRLRMVFTFAVAVLAGLGASSLSESVNGRSMTRTTRGLLLGLAVLALVILVLTRWLVGSQVPAAALQWAFGLANPGMYWPVLVALSAFVVFALYERNVLGGRMMQALVLLLVAVDLFALGMNFHTTVPEDLIFPETAALELLQSDEDLFRIVGTNNDLMPNSSMLYGLQDVRGLDFPDRRYLQLCEAIGGQDRLGYVIVFTERLQPGLLGLMNVKYVLTSADLDQEILAHLAFVAEDKDIRVYQNQAFLPRSFIVHRARMVGTEDEALAALQSPDLDLGAEIVLEEAPPADFAALLEPAAQATAEITRYDPNRVTVTASTSADGFLFLSDRYDPGWKAYVDGVQTKVYRADYVFRAVYLAAGQHQVDFVYAPRSFALALPISLLAGLGLTILLASPWLKRLWSHVRRPAHPGQTAAYAEIKIGSDHDTP